MGLVEEAGRKEIADKSKRKAWKDSRDEIIVSI
jgi:hypothetical protein